MRVGRLDRRANASGAFVDLGDHGATLDRVRRGHAAERHDRAACTLDSGRKRLNRGRRDTRCVRCRGDRALPYERGTQRHIRTGLRGNPLVGVQTSQRATGTDVHELGSPFDLGPGVSPIQLLRNGVPPSVKKVGSEADNQLRRAKVQPRPRGAVGLLIGGDRRRWREGVHTQVRGHTLRDQPLIEKARECARLVSIDEHRIGCLPFALHLAKFLRQRLECLFPRGGFEDAAVTHHWRAIAIRVVQPLHRRQSRRANRATIHRMLGIALELYWTTVTYLSEYTARGGALTACGRVILRHARDGIVGRRDVRNELPHFLRGAAHHRRRRASNAKDLKEVPTLDAGPRFSAHAVNSAPDGHTWPTTCTRRAVTGWTRVKRRSVVADGAIVTRFPGRHRFQLRRDGHTGKPRALSRFIALHVAVHTPAHVQ